MFLTPYLGNSSQLGNVSQTAHASLSLILGRVVAIKKGPSGKVYCFFRQKYSPLPSHAA
jgi:hypothetical protein